jgi:hypothetical protein
VAARKGAGTEVDTNARLGVLDAMIADLLSDKLERITGHDRGSVGADARFAAIVLGARSEQILGGT